MHYPNMLTDAVAHLQQQYDIMINIDFAIYINVTPGG